MPPTLELLDARLSAALGGGQQVRKGISAYAWLQDRYRRRCAKTGRERAAAWLAEEMVAYAIYCYKNDVSERDTRFLLFSDRGVNFLYEEVSERVLLVYGRSPQDEDRGEIPKRDEAYHAGAPYAGLGFDKGHLWAHAQGGFEGGPNYISQARTLNQSRSANGKLWRAIERYLAANPGTDAFVRPGWGASGNSSRPHEIEYCLVPPDGQIRSCVFPNEN